MHQPERRKSVRRRQLKSAIIAFNNRHSTMPANMRDISDGGARLEAPGNMVPDTFELLVEMDGLEAPCRVVWRRSNEIGVAFTGPLIRKQPRRAQVVEAVNDRRSLRKKTARQEPNQPLVQSPMPATPSASPAVDNPPAAPAALLPEPAPEHQPAPVLLKLDPVFPKAARFKVAPLLGVPEGSDERIRAAIVAELAAGERATFEAKPPFIVNGALTAAKTGTSLKYTYVVDVVTRGGRPMHRINGHVAAQAVKGQSIWAPLERETGARIAHMIVHDILSHVAD